MRERHFPRVCSSCHAPMARQEDACWRCGTEWASEDRPQTTLELIVGGAHVASDAPPGADRRLNEGGGFVSEAAARVR